MHPKYWNRGRKPVYHKPMDGDATGGGGALDVQSAGDALAALMGDDDAPSADAAPAAGAGAVDAAADDAEADQGMEGEGDPAAEPDADAITVEVDGKPVALTRAQIADAYKAGLQQQDLSRESAQVAEQRKAAEAETQKARTERSQYAQNLQQILAANQYHDQQATKWTPELIEAYPVGYNLAQFEAQARAQQSQQAHAQLQQIQHQEHQEREQAAKDSQVKEMTALRSKVVAWKDDAVMKKEVGEIVTWLQGQGFTPADLAGLQDHRMVLLARGAMQHELITNRAKETAKKVATVPPKVAAPGRQPIAPTDGRTVAMKQLKASGSVNDAASLLAGML